VLLSLGAGQGETFLGVPSVENAYIPRPAQGTFQRGFVAAEQIAGAFSPVPLINKPTKIGQVRSLTLNCGAALAETLQLQMMQTELAGRYWVGQKAREIPTPTSDVRCRWRLCVLEV
jgi:hypothetical protein